MFRFIDNFFGGLPDLLETEMRDRVFFDYRVRSLALVGKGSFGQVYRIDTGLWSNQPPTVLKIQTAENGTTKACKDMHEGAKNEAEIVKSLDHPNIIKLIKYMAYPNPYEPQLAGYFTIQFEMCEKSLHDFIGENQRNGELYDRFISENMLKQIGGAVKYMHSLHIVHHDIKTDNIMVVNDRVPRKKLQFKLIDFGLAQRYPAKLVEDTFDGQSQGTEWNMCQEKLAWFRREKHARPYNPYLADVFALGITCIECALGYEDVPWRHKYGRRDGALLSMLIKLPRASHVSEFVRSRLHKMLQQYEQNRSHMHEIL